MVRAVRHRDVATFLRAKGWWVDRIKGSHEVWCGPRGEGRLVLPRHGEISPGVVRQVVKRFPDVPGSWR
ncbi:type II toxin-antitoxin system HicA family toxin [Curtobacterium sp. Leaf183]|uniref:type II toxin-antitoxin system HicA family toxin n=1 Tax=Curtobacterium sp. Leaf183 TaxID=1736291 RepID=UPI0039E02EE8